MQHASGFTKTARLSSSLLLAAAAGVSATSYAANLPKSVGALEVSKPAFLFLEEMNLPQAAGKTLVVTSFNPFGNDGIYVYPDIGRGLANLKAQRAVDFATVRWPNEAHMAPRDLVGRDVLVVSGGFLVPGKGTGAVTLITPEDGKQHQITQDKSGFFYHRTHFVDFNGDGRLDILTARANKPIFGASKGELLWLEQPASNPLGGKWKEHLLAEGPDVHFRAEDLDGDGSEEIVATEFFSKKLTLWWKEGTGYKSRNLDPKVGSAFDVQVVDVNADGRKDLLVTNHEGDAKASVFAYEVPDDMKAGEFKRHTLLTGIETRQGGFNQASPGQAWAFFPKVDVTTGKPLILVSGDGSQRAHLLTPKSESATDWSYEESELVNARSTVGQSVVGDADGDGWVEIFVPAYDANKIHVFSYGK